MLPSADELASMNSLLSLASEQEVIELREAVEAMRRYEESQVVWSPIVPTPRQAEFLALDCEEALYGGAAGSGKSGSLLAWALEGVDTPGYAAILFRRTFPELEQPGGFIPMSHAWGLKQKGAHWNGSTKTWTFPSGAVLKFASMQYEADAYKFYGGEYTRAVFDEATMFTEMQYLWIMSRLRRKKDFPFQPQIRCGTNPGGPGHFWCKRRFLTDEAITALQDGKFGVYYKDGRAFVPARLDDNPHLDREDYRQKLQHLPPVLRERLLNGDWTIMEDAIIKQDRLRYFEMQGMMLRAIRPEGGIVEGGVVDSRECVRFATVDTAGTDEDAARKARGREPSWTVAAVWDYWPKRKYLFLRHILRRRVAWDDLRKIVPDTLADWGVKNAVVENAHHGVPLASELRRRGITVKMFQPSKSKILRSVQLQNKLDAGEVYLPRGNNSWLNDWEAEVLSWRGEPGDADDQVDVASMAAIHVAEEASNWGGPVTGRENGWAPVAGGGKVRQLGGRRVARTL